MKFYRILLTLTAVLSAVGANARVMYIGNLLHEGMFYNAGISKKDTTSSAVKITPEDLKNVLGSNLKSVAAYYKESSAPKYFRIFISRDLDSDVIFDTIVAPDSVKYGWNIIDLDIPCPVQSDTLYLGCDVRTDFAGYAFVNDYPIASFIRKGRQNQWKSEPGVAVYGIVEGDNLPANDVSLSLLNSSIESFTDELFDAGLIINNLAADTIRSVEIIIKDDSDLEKVHNVSDLDIPYLKSDTIFIDNLSFSDANLHTVNFTVAKVNGEADFDDSNNSQILKVNVLTEQVQRKVLLEVFSTERCTGCPKGHEKLDVHIGALGDNKENVIEVSHHVGFYTDQWTLPNASQYERFYQIVTTFAPAAMINRTNMYEYGAKNPYQGGENSVVFDIPETDDIYGLFNVALAKPAEAKIKLVVSSDQSKINIDVTGKSLFDLENDARLTVYITEDNLYTDRQAGWSENIDGPYYQHGVNRAYVSDQWGDAVDLNNGFKKSYEVNIDPKWNADNLNVVAFVHNSSNDANTITKYQGFNVYNAEKVQVNPHSVDVEDVEVSPIYVVSRTDGVVEIVGDYDSGRVYTMNGVEVCSMRGSPLLSVSNWAKGVYVFEFLLPDGNVCRTKVII